MFIGNRHVKSHFERLIEGGNLGHAYLFHGPEGVGKRTLALELAKQVSGSLDLKIIDKGGDHILISDIRELKEFVYLTPFGSHKVALMDNAHNLTQDAANALLKVLEEPPGKSIVFLISHLPGQIAETVVSRCQTWRFNPLKKEEICGHLIARKVKKEVASRVSQMAGGSPGRALEMAENFEEFKKNIAILQKLVKADFVSRFETAKKLAADPEDLKKTVGDWFVYSAALNPEGVASRPYGAGKRLAGKLLHLSNVLARPQFNHRLALEEFLLNV